MSRPHVKKCQCGRPAHERCGLCRRRLCPRHSAVMPRAALPGKTDGGIEAVCMPACSSDFWLAPELVREWKPSGEVLAEVEAAW